MSRRSDGRRATPRGPDADQQRRVAELLERKARAAQSRAFEREVPRRLPGHGHRVHRGR